jgi:cytochrome c-type biogenesis protein CcmE
MSKNTKIIIALVIFLGTCITATGYILINGSVAYLVSTVSQPSAQYFMTVSEVENHKDEMPDRQIRISGAVIGDSIEFDESTKNLSFFIADVPADYAEVEQQGGLAVVLENAVNDPNRKRVQVVYVGEKPELLQNMTQAIIVGRLHENGVFYAEEILLRCPSRYEEAIPDQVAN